MTTNKRIKVEDVSKTSEKLSDLRKEDFKPLPPPFDTVESEPEFSPLSDKAKEQYESSLDDTIAVSIPKPKDSSRGWRKVQLFSRVKSFSIPERNFSSK